MTFTIAYEPSGIDVLSVDGRVIAVSRLERLVALLEAGFNEALCVVHYGYGTDMLQNCFPSVEASQLTSTRPPMVSDFTDPDLTIAVAVPTPRNMVRISQASVDMTEPK